VLRDCGEHCASSCHQLLAALHVGTEGRPVIVDEPEHAPLCGPQRLEKFGFPADHLNVRQQIKVLVVFVLAALALSEQLLGLDKFNPLDPLDHFVAKLVFNT
jgi:hypothetical protein